jgi:hypothetical protein
MQIANKINRSAAKSNETKHNKKQKKKKKKILNEITALEMEILMYMYLR